ncbi:hypothetical protein IKF03_00345 [Candidatus Saccharibacteria bacterium]|nr:hypothetical protein [Candidatus Saccharibacteria bacterium]
MLYEFYLLFFCWYNRITGSTKGVELKLKDGLSSCPTNGVGSITEDVVGI